MKAYFAIVEKNPKSAFGISFPDLPYVFSGADEKENILNNAIEALSLWAETEKLPIASTLEDIQSQKAIKKTLSNGAFLIRVPLVENNK